MINKNNQPLLWGLLHGLNDFTAGFMLAGYTLTRHNGDGFLFIVIYAIIAFGGQLPVGFWLDHKKQVRPFSIASLVLLSLAVPVYFVSAGAGIIMSGLASAFVHVTGGAVCLLAGPGGGKQDNRSGPLGLFTAPGVLGLTLGGVLAQYGTWQLAIIAALILPVGFLIMMNRLPAYRSPQNKQSELDAHDWLMLSILLIMCFRSFIFDVINHMAHDHENGILVIGISAFTGKLIGGFVADRIGWKKFVYISLPVALLLFQFGRENIYALAFGIACLQGSVPVTLLLMGRSLPLYPATASALSLGSSIALAGLPLYLVGNDPIIMPALNNGWLTLSVFAMMIITWLMADRYFFRKAFDQPVGPGRF